MNLVIPKTLFRRAKKVNFEIYDLLNNARKNSEKAIHLGCGNTIIDGMINCDLYNENADMKINVTDLNIFKNCEIDLIEHHHLIEHLSFNEINSAIKEWYRVLKPKGLLIFSCPNLFRICLRFLWLETLNNFIVQKKEIDYTIKMLVGSQENVGMFHKNAFSKSTVFRLLNNSGFSIKFFYKKFPIRPTPSMLVIAVKS